MKRNLKSILSCLLMLCLLTALSACGGSSTSSTPASTAESTTSNKPATQQEESPASSEESTEELESSAQALTIPDDVQAAIEAGNHLTTGEYFLAEDGSILTLKKPKLGNDIEMFCKTYAALPNVKKLVLPSSQTEVFALTESGDLYYRDTKFLENVLDMVYKTNNVNQVAYAVTADNLYRVNVQDTWDVNENLRESNPDNYTDVAGGKTVSSYGDIFVDNFMNDGKTTKGPYVSISAARSDFAVVTAGGKVFREMDTPEDYETIPNIDSWENVVLFSSRKDMLSSFGDDEREVDVSAAAILADGTVVAEGSYAEDILSWGPLSFLSLADAVIVGLTPEGEVKVAGPDADVVAAEVAGWTGITGVRASTDSGDCGIINAIDQEGNWYYLYFSPEEIIQNMKLSVTDGMAPESGTVYKVTPDGTFFKAGWDTGVWEPYELED